MDAFSDSRSVDLLAHNGGWLKNVVRRNTQVAPDGELSKLNWKINWQVVSTFLHLLYLIFYFYRRFFTRFTSWKWSITARRCGRLADGCKEISIHARHWENWHKSLWRGWEWYSQQERLWLRERRRYHQLKKGNSFKRVCVPYLETCSFYLLC